jgi:hypothetical protein
MDMQANENKKLTSFLRNEDGIMAVVFALCLPVFVVFAALAIDMGYSYWKRNMVQVDSSASSLAGAGTLMDDGIYDPVNEVVVYVTVDKNADGIPDNDDSDADTIPDGAIVFNEALLYAEKNIPGEDILAAADLHAGNWEPTTRIFTSAGTWDPGTLTFDDSQQQEYDAAIGTFTDVDDPVVPLNSVLAITRRADDGPNANPLPLFLAAAVGLPEVNINTAAIATVGPRISSGFSGCLMAMNETAEETFYAFGTADISAYDCDIYVNSSNDCALAGNGEPIVEVGDELNPGMIYVVGDYCATNDGVEYNCYLSEEDLANNVTCPKTDLSYEEQQIDPFAYTNEELFADTSGLSALHDLACGSEYGPDPTADPDYNYSIGSLATYYQGSLGAAYDPTKHTGIGEFEVDSYVTEDFCADADGLGTPDPYQDATCTGVSIDPVLDGDGNPIITGGKVLTDTMGWTWTGEGFEFHLVPGAYCGGINVRGNGTIVFADGDYVLKGQAAAGENGGRDEFNLRANTAIEGSNVAFYLADADIKINWGGTADVDLIGRQLDSDPMHGFLFYADPSNLGPHQFRGTPAGGYQGIMYFPEGEVVFKGTADSSLAQEDGTGICTMLVADTLYFNGTTAFNASVDGCGAGGFDIVPFGAKLVLRLVH